MSLLYTCVLVTVLGQVWSQSPCCVPEQWEGIQETVTGQVTQGFGEVTRTRTAVSYDYTNRRVATMSNVTLSDNQQRRTLNLLLYKDKTSYALDLMTGVCTTQTLDTDMASNCLPDNSRKVGDVYFGSYLQPLMATEYSFQQETLTGTVSVTTQCVPLTETVFGTVNGAQILQAVEFVNITPGIARPDVFDVPQPCQKALEMFKPASRPHGLISV